MKENCAYPAENLHRWASARGAGACAVLAVLALLASACSRAAERHVSTSTTTSTTSSSSTTSTVTAPSTTTTTAAPPQVTAAPAQPAAAACPPVPARVDPRPDRSHYDLAIAIKPDENVVEGVEKVDFTPDLDTDRVVFRLWANAPRIAQGGGHIDVSTGDEHQQPDVTTFVLPKAVKAGQRVHVEFNWRLTLPGAIDDRIARSGDNIRLGSFFPILAWEPGVGWATDAPTSGFAEASLSVASDFDVTIAAPDGFDVLASGRQDGPGHWTATAAPDFAMSLGHFALASGVAHAPEAVTVTVGVSKDIAESPQVYLNKAVRVLEDFGRRFGPFPWPAYTLAITPKLNGGIEYPMHVMQGPGHIGRTTSHEIGHQWFYALVESDQGRDPWIDEGMASYAEARFENSLGSFVAKAIPADGKGRAGEPMTYWEPRQASYYRSVYVQGVQALAALGPADSVDCALRQLVARQSFRVTRNAEVIAALSIVFPDAANVLARYGIRS